MAPPEPEMAFDSTRADLVIQFALLVAGEQDDAFQRQLGPIHLIKYAYLADIAYARRFNGQSFTGAIWRFHHFGPWNAAVYERVEPATRAILAERINFPSNYDDKDCVRYRSSDPDRMRVIEREVPAVIAMEIRRNVRKFLADTPALLDHVYKSTPMLSAAPGESLDLATVSRVEQTSNVDASLPSRMTALSRKKKTRFQERIRKIHERQAATPKLINPVTRPRYDETYQQGLAWLEELGGSSKFLQGEFVVEFSEEVWKSSTRKGEDVS